MNSVASLGDDNGGISGASGEGWLRADLGATSSSASTWHAARLDDDSGGGDSGPRQQFQSRQLRLHLERRHKQHSSSSRSSGGPTFFLLQLRAHGFWLPETA